MVKDGDILDNMLELLSCRVFQDHHKFHCICCSLFEQAPLCYPVLLQHRCKNFSFVLDGVDGWFARKFNQASTFGSVLDMVTDRVSTACLLALLSQCYKPGLIFLMLLGLDITSHWFQMYSSLLSGKTSHKDVKHTNNWLLKLYYGYRPFMAFCCVSCEVLYIILFLFADEKSTSLLSVCRVVMKQSPLIVLVFISTLVGWAVKQVSNITQMKTAADTCVEFDPKHSK
ncbi:probable CDP-diacylglycerol--inositol 3-phosphatidyltransferase 2 isoform X1 [Setaria italica]|uniref:probable CDP-diacylglycerol--inositol 3-phosphatidyltransferase 2 isoform X1 n=2 Tax=Setaria italica TaxID=4555 RepID=UPI000BE544A7|nr:probable CDP-diacylglycerol--inositol 3-phosphatidyltransferase 2 isoform X1 [Setaria italica]